MNADLSYLQPRRLRVLHVIASASPVRGGTSTAIWSLLDALSQQDIEADLLTTDDDGPGRRLSMPLERFVEQHGHRVRYFPRQTSFYGASGPLAMWLIKHVREYDLVHVHGLFGFVPTTAARIALARGVPYMVCPHGMLESWARDNGRPILKRLSTRFVEGPILKHAARVHFTSNSEKKQAEELRVPISSVVIPLGLKENTLGVEMSRSSETSRSPATIVFLSRIDVKKGIDVLLDAFAQVLFATPSARLIIAGDGPAELIDQLKSRASRLGIENCVSWAGFVAGEEKRKLLATATVFALSSYSENFGFAVAEAMAAGLPVVVSRAVGVSDLVERVGAGIVTETSADSVSAALQLLLHDKTARDRMGGAGREAVRRELSLKSFGEKMADVYRQITSTETAC